MAGNTVANASYPTELKWVGGSGQLNQSVSAALQNMSDPTVYLLIKRNTENSQSYAFRFVTDENTDPTYGGVDARPELRLAVTVLEGAPLVSVTAADANATENGNAGEQGADTATFTITRTVNLDNALSVSFSYSGPSVLNSDYIRSQNSPVVLPAGVASTNITITALGDTTPEDDENVTLTIGGGGVSYGIGVGAATVKIRDDNDGSSLAQYFFGNSLAPQVWNDNVIADPLTVPGLAVTFSTAPTYVISPPGAYLAMNSLTTTNEAGAITGNDYLSAVISPKFGSSVTFTNLEISSAYYDWQTNAMEAVLFIRSSLDNFATNIGAITNTAVPYFNWQPLSIQLGAEFANRVTPTEFRLYVYDDINADSLETGLRLENFYLKGSAAPLTVRQHVKIEATSTNAAEPSTSGAFTISRAGNVSEALDVYYNIGGTASNGLDYATISGVATFAPGVTSSVVSIATIDDQIAEATESVVLTIVNTNGLVSIYGSGSASLTITDNAEPTQVYVVASDNNAYERVGTLTGQFTIARAGDVSGGTTVSFTLGGTAAPGADYISSITDSVTFASGETNKVITITPIDNVALDGTRTVVLTLASGGYLLLDGTVATVSIYDDEQSADTVLFSDAFETTASANNYSVLEVARDNGSPDSTVDYSFDYSSIGLPPAPGSATTKGLKLTVNKTGTNQSAAINLFPVNLTVSENYAVRFNLFQMWNSASNFVDQALVGINQSGTIPNWYYQTVQTVGIFGDGQYVGIGNTSTDPVLFFFNTTNVGSAPVRSQINREAVVANFNNPPYGDPGGLAGVLGTTASSTTKTWLDCELSQVAGVVRFRINGTALYTFTNTAAFTSGKVMIGYMDAFDSLGPVESFAIFDNVRVVQLPATVSTSPKIDQINVSGGTVTISFSDTGAPASTAFKLMSSDTANGTYTEDNSANITGSAGSYQATTAVNGSSKFYRIKK